ncbi:hypothetical protein UPYG_G00342500 [Umbra pygmaea]|uniref:Uncharacterized protein n=1 Tax=Umbra pygmaea TaxID=75934 RepID=A0ABD0WEF1_UMBPY
MPVCAVITSSKPGFCKIGRLLLQVKHVVGWTSPDQPSYRGWVSAVKVVYAMEELNKKPKKYPLVRAASVESSSELSSSTIPGDTLPWNLPKHHRIKRSKSASGDVHVLDPAERAVLRIADIQ